MSEKRFTLISITFLISSFFVGIAIGIMIGYQQRDRLAKSEECYGKYVNAKLSDIPFNCLEYIKNP